MSAQLGKLGIVEIDLGDESIYGDTCADNSDRLRLDRYSEDFLKDRHRSLLTGAKPNDWSFEILIYWMIVHQWSNGQTTGWLPRWKDQSN